VIVVVVVAAFLLAIVAAQIEEAVAAGEDVVVVAVVNREGNLSFLIIIAIFDFGRKNFSTRTASDYRWPRC